MSSIIAAPIKSPLLDAPKQIINGASSNGYTPTLISLSGMGAKQIQSGALTANVLTQVLNVTGPGVIELLGLSTNDATSRTMRAQLVIDGVTVFDSTSAAVAAGSSGVILVGNYLNTGSALVYGITRVPFRSSFQFSIASSLTETNKLTTYAQYMTT